MDPRRFDLAFVLALNAVLDHWYHSLPVPLPVTIGSTASKVATASTASAGTASVPSAVCVSHRYGLDTWFHSLPDAAGAAIAEAAKRRAVMNDMRTILKLF